MNHNKYRLQLHCTWYTVPVIWNISTILRQTENITLWSGLWFYHTHLNAKAMRVHIINRRPELIWSSTSLHSSLYIPPARHYSPKCALHHTTAMTNTKHFVWISPGRVIYKFSKCWPACDLTLFVGGRFEVGSLRSPTFARGATRVVKANCSTLTSLTSRVRSAQQLSMLKLTSSTVWLMSTRSGHRSLLACVLKSLLRPIVMLFEIARAAMNVAAQNTTSLLLYIVIIMQNSLCVSAGYSIRARLYLLRNSRMHVWGDIEFENVDEIAGVRNCETGNWPSVVQGWNLESTM